MNEFDSSLIINGDALSTLKTIASDSIQVCVTSPPYWGLRDYGVEGQLGAEKTPDEYVRNLVQVFSEVRRALKRNGTLWLNLGDSYLSDKNLAGIPWRVAFALQSNGWYLRQDIIWHKPNPMPESIRDRCTKSHEYIFLFSKSQKYKFDCKAIRESAIDKRGPGNKIQIRQVPGHENGVRHNLHKIKATGFRNKRSVWSVTTKPFKDAHFATFPVDLIEPCILAGSSAGDIVLDPFFGAGTVGVASKKHDREYVGIELNLEYARMAQKRIDAIFDPLKP